MSRNTRARLIPRTDVGGSVLAGAAGTLLLLTQHDAVFEIDAVSAAVGVVLIGLAGYLPRKYKSFIMASAAVLSSLIAFFIGWLFFDSPWDPNIVSFSLATLAVAFAGYVFPARNPDASPAQELDAALGADIDRRRNRT